MKKYESESSGQSTAPTREAAGLNDVFRDVLPILFHKLKNRLTPIIGYTQILKSRSTDDHALERLAKIESNAAELANYLNVMKDYFRAPALVRRPANLNRIVEKWQADWQRQAVADGITMRISLARQLPDLLLHAGQIMVLLQNLAANSRSALAQKGSPDRELHLTTRLLDGVVQLVVRDNGIGIDCEKLNEIWTPFYTTFAGGSGLGLVICEKIIANHGGQCRVRSEPGEFSEFEISFPVPDAPRARKGKSVKKGSSESQ
jgi:signal transduction histidine kinase